MRVLINQQVTIIGFISRKELINCLSSQISTIYIYMCVGFRRYSLVVWCIWKKNMSSLILAFSYLAKLFMIDIWLLKCMFEFYHNKLIWMYLQITIWVDITKGFSLPRFKPENIFNVLLHFGHFLLQNGVKFYSNVLFHFSLQNRIFLIYYILFLFKN